MAKQTGIIKLQGTIGDISFYKQQSTVFFGIGRAGLDILFYQNSESKTYMLVDGFCMIKYLLGVEGCR